MKDAAEEAEVDEKTAIQIYQYCRDLCSWRLLNHDSPMMLGGQGGSSRADRRESVPPQTKKPPW